MMNKKGRVPPNDVEQMRSELGGEKIDSCKWDKLIRCFNDNGDAVLRYEFYREKYLMANSC